MAGTTLEQLIRDADSLSVEDMIRLSNELRERALRKQSGAKLSWHDVRGKLQLEDGFDAQEWVSKLRAESDWTFGNEA